MDYHGVPWITMVYHGLPWTTLDLNLFIRWFLLNLFSSFSLERKYIIVKKTFQFSLYKYFNSLAKFVQMVDIFLIFVKFHDNKVWWWPLHQRTCMLVTSWTLTYIWEMMIPIYAHGYYCTWIGKYLHVHVCAFPNPNAVDMQYGCSGPRQRS